MAIGHKKDGFEILIWEVFRGTGRQFGRDLSKEITKGVKSKVLNNDSKYRKYIDRFALTGNTKTSVQKLYQLIDQFHQEYTTTKAMLQSSWYLGDDVSFINQKIKMVKRMCFNPNEFQALQNLEDSWSEILIEVKQVQK
jgi:DNA repair ATPase RecN